MCIKINDIQNSIFKVNSLKNIRNVYFRYNIRKLQNLSYFSEFSGNQNVESSCTSITVNYIKLEFVELPL